MRLISKLAVVLFLPAATFADTHYVSLDSTNPVLPYSEWSTAATNIQEAIDASSNGDAVLVTNGTYLLTGTISVSKDVNLVGVNGATNTILDGSSRHFTCLSLNSANAVVDGFTVTKGDSDSLGSGSSAAGVNVAAGVIRNCIITGNKGEMDGVGGYAVGLAISGGYAYECVVSGNSLDSASGSGNAAAGICCVGDGVVRDCLVLSNVVRDVSGLGRAGAVQCVYGGLMENCRIEGNSVNQVSGSGHTTAGVGCSGGAVVRNCLIIGNSITGHMTGTAFELLGGGASCSSNGLFQNCTIVSNRISPRPGTQGGGAGGIYCYDGARVWNTIVSGNIVTNIPFDPFVQCNADVLGGGVAWGMVGGNPRFVNLAAGDCHLLSNSPCIDSGATNGAPDADFDGVPRPLDGNNDGTNAYDIGAYEFVNTNADSDADSLPDYWEVARGLDPRVATTTNGAAGDADGDAVDNWSEYVADTDPQSSTSMFAVAVSPGTDDWLIQFVSSGARIYSLQYAESLSSPIQWSDVIGQTNRTGVGGSMSLSDTNAADFRAYRVRVSFQ